MDDMSIGVTRRFENRVASDLHQQNRELELWK